MIDARPFAAPEDYAAFEAYQTLTEVFRLLHGREMTQADLDQMTAKLGLPYRIDVEQMRRWVMA